MKFFIRLIACLSLESVRSLGAVLGRLLYRFNRPFRGHLKENLGYAGLYSEDFAKRVAKHIGIQALEAVWVLWDLANIEYGARRRWTTKFA